MRHNKLALFLHLVWSTWDRLPMISPEIERRIYRNVESEAVKMGCTVLAINGMPEHVHVLASIPTTITIAELVKQVKGVSSHFVNESLQSGGDLFKWQGSYGAFTVSRWDVERVIRYIKRQKERHCTQEIVAEWEETYEEVE